MRERKISGDEKRVVKRKEEKRKEDKRTREDGRERKDELNITCLFISSLFVSYVGIILLFPFSFFLILISIFYTL